jgi:uncharacterized protein (TIGR00369 family)
MQPDHANHHGNVHGGWIMKLADEAGALAAMRHAQTPVVTVAIDQMSFHEPIRIGDLVILDAIVTYVGKTSIESRVHVTAENPITGEKTHTNTAYFVYVALDPDGTPIAVPQLHFETEIERERFQAGQQRQAHRLRRLRSEVEEENG